MAIGRISGSVLKSNLTRNGVDLAFETNLLYLDVTNSRVGIGTSEPTSTLHVSGTTTSTNLSVSGTTTIATPTADLHAATKKYVDDNIASFISSEADTLNTVTGRGATTTNAITVGGLTSNGNVVINGEVSSADSSLININDGLNVNGVINANASGNSILVADTLRIAQTGSGLRMTNVGAFDNDGSDNFRIFGVNDLSLHANGSAAGTKALSIDATNKDVRIHNDLIADGSVFADSIKSSGSNADIVLDPQGTGNVTIGSNLVVNGTISTDDSTILTVADNLRVTGLTTDNAFLINAGNGQIGETTTLTVDPDSNYLGINQTSPEVTLHMTGEGSQSSQIRMEQYNDNQDAPDIRIYRRRGTIASPADVQTSDYLFRINVHGQDGGSGSDPVYHSLQFDVDSTDQDAGTVNFETRDTNGNSASRLFIDSSGQVRFGTSAAGYTFPSSRGTNGQALITDGSGNLSFGSVTTSDTLSDVTGRGASTSDQVTLSGGLVIGGNVETADSSNINFADAITANTGTSQFYNLQVNNEISLGGAGSQYLAFNEDSVKVKFANWYSSNDRQYGQGQLWFEMFFAAVDNTDTANRRRIGFYLDKPNKGATNAEEGSGAHPNNHRAFIDNDSFTLSAKAPLRFEESIDDSSNIYYTQLQGQSALSANRTITLPDATGTVVLQNSTDTLTNKTIALGSNTVSGTTAQFNSALSDGSFATLAGSETLTNKTLTTPTISGEMTVDEIKTSDSSALYINSPLRIDGLGSANETVLVGTNGLLTSSDLLAFDTGNNRVGIGTTSPATKFHIAGEGTNEGQIRLQQANNGSDGPDFAFYSSRGTISSLSASQSGDTHGRVNSYAHNGTSFVQSGSFGWSGTDTSSNNTFDIRSRSGGTLAKRIEVLSGGDIRFNDAYTFPTADGSANQVLQTDGAGNIDFADITSDIITIVGDDSSGTSINNGETFKFAGATGITTAVSGDTLTITGPDLSSYITASSTTTFTNKTFDVEATGNSISNIDVADFKSAAIVTESEGLNSSDNDTSLPTTAAVKDYVDTASANTGDITFNGSTIQSPSNADITLDPGGTGTVVINGLSFPTGDGSANQVLATNGSGQLSFVNSGAADTDSDEAGAGSESTDLGTGSTVINSFNISTYDSAFYFLVTRDEVNQTLDLRRHSLTHNDSNAFVNTFGQVRSDESGSYITVDADVNSNLARLTATGQSVSNSVSLYRIVLGQDTSASTDGNTAFIVNTDVDSATENLDTWSASTYRGAQYFISATNATTGESSNMEALVVTDGTSAFITPYGNVNSGNNDLVSLSADVSGGNVRLRASAGAPNTRVAMYRILLGDSESASSGSSVNVIGATTVSSSSTTLDSFSSDDYHGAMYLVVGHNSTEGASSVSTVYMLNDENDTFVSTGPTVSSKGTDQLTFTGSFSGGTATLSCSSSSGGSTTVNAYRIHLKRGAANTVTTNTTQTISGTKTFTSAILADTLRSPASNADITLDPQGTGVINAQADIVLQANGTIGSSGDASFLKFNETSTTYSGHDVSLGSNQSVHMLIDMNEDGSSIGGFTVRHGANTIDDATEVFKVAGTGAVTINNAYTLPTSDGSANQVLRTDGSGTVAFGEPNREIVNALSAAASVALDPTLGGIQTITLGQDTTFTLSNWASGHRMTLMIDDGTNRTVTWPTMQWAGGVAPTLATTGFNTIELWYVGSTLYGAYVGAHS